MTYEIKSKKGKMIEFKDLIGKKITVTAKVARINGGKHMIENYILLHNVYVNEEYFRDHCYITLKRRLSVLKYGDYFTATAEMYEYIDSNDLTKKKIGLRGFRSISKILVK